MTFWLVRASDKCQHLEETIRCPPGGTFSPWPLWSNIAEGFLKGGGGSYMTVTGQADLGVMDTNRHVCPGLESRPIDKGGKHHGAGETMIRNDKKWSRTEMENKPRSSQVTLTPILEHKGKTLVVESLELEGDVEIRPNEQVCCSKWHLPLSIILGVYLESIT